MSVYARNKPCLLMHINYIMKMAVEERVELTCHQQGGQTEIRLQAVYESSFFCVARSTRGTEISSLLQKQRGQRANTWSQESQFSQLQDNKSNKQNNGSRVFPPHVIHTSIFTWPLLQMIFFKEVASSCPLYLWNFYLKKKKKSGEEKIQNRDKTKLLIIWSLNRRKRNK